VITISVEHEASRLQADEKPRYRCELLAGNSEGAGS
jgi:hypothetical protein